MSDIRASCQPGAQAGNAAQLQQLRERLAAAPKDALQSLTGLIRSSVDELSGERGGLWQQV